MPKKIEGAWIWTKVMPQLVPEINFKNLLELGTIARHKKKVEIYGYLRASIRKIQWTKIAGLRAIAIERDIEKQMEPGIMILDPLGITDHSLCITDCLVHTKSALDSLAVFLNELLGLGAKGGKRDPKHDKFRRQIIAKDHAVGKVIKKLEPWLIDLQNLRDEWIHRTTVEDVILIGPSKLGVLPLPRKAHIEMKEANTSKDLWSTSGFVKYHYDQFIILLNAIVERCIQIEAKDLDRIPVPNPKELGVVFFNTRLIENMTVKAIRMSNITLSGYYKRLSEMFEGFEFFRLDGSHWEFLTNLARGLCQYVRAYFDIPGEIPNIRVIFVEESKFDNLRNFKKLPKTTRNIKATTIHKGFLDPEGKEECYFIVIQETRLARTKRYLVRHLRQKQSTSDTILRSLIHEVIHLYEETTSRKYLHLQTLITEDEINICSKFKEDHPELFTKQTNENMLKTLRKMPNNSAR